MFNLCGFISFISWQTYMYIVDPASNWEARENVIGRMRSVEDLHSDGHNINILLRSAFNDSML